MSFGPPRTIAFATLGLVLLACSESGPPAPSSSQPAPLSRLAPGARPNVLVIMSDDQSSDTLSSAGHPWLETPNLDRIASEGVRFSNAFVTTSVCSPARASFLTGLWVRAHGVHDNLTPLPPDLPNAASVLAAAGWDTAYFGKWHMGTQLERPGFAHAWSYLDQGQYRMSEFHSDGTRFGRAPEGFVDDITTTFAVRWLKQERDRPFLAWVGFKAAHGPREPKAELADLFAGVTPPTPPSVDALPPYPRPGEFQELAAAAGIAPREFEPPDDWAAGFERPVKEQGAFTGESMLDYTRLIAGLDENVGRLLDTLDTLGLAENTIVVFVSDNGYLHGQHGSSGKRTAYDESLRVPFLLRWPAGIEAGQLPRELVLNVDLAPTLIDLAGVAVPASMQGRSVRSLVAPESGEEAAAWRSAFVCEYYRHDAWLQAHYAIPTHFALRSERAKYVTYPGHPGWEEVFDLVRDPLEMQNLAARPETPQPSGGPAAAGPEEAAPNPRDLRAHLARLESELGPRLDLGRR